MTSDDHTTSASLDRISRAMDRQPRFLNLRDGGNLPRLDLLDVHPAWIVAAFVACVAALIAFDWILQRYLF